MDVKNVRKWCREFSAGRLNVHHEEGRGRPSHSDETVQKVEELVLIFWDRKGVLMIDFMPRGTIINADRYSETVRKLRRAIENKRRGMLTKGVRQHESSCSQQNNVTHCGIWLGCVGPPSLLSRRNP